MIDEDGSISNHFVLTNILAHKNRTHFNMIVRGQGHKSKSEWITCTEHCIIPQRCLSTFKIFDQWKGKGSRKWCPLIALLICCSRWESHQNLSSFIYTNSFAKFPALWQLIYNYLFMQYNNGTITVNCIHLVTVCFLLWRNNSSLYCIQQKYNFCKHVKPILVFSLKKTFKITKFKQVFLNIKYHLESV